MSRRIAMQIENPDDIDVTMTITLPLRQWMELKDHLGAGSAYPDWWISGAINAAIIKARANITQEVTKE